MSAKFEFADKFGYNAPFQFNEEQEEGIYDGFIDYQKLGDALAKYNSFLFNYKDFISNKSAIPPNAYPTGGSVSGPVRSDNPLRANLKKGGSKKIKISGKLNKNKKRVGVRKNRIFFDFELSAKKYTRYIKKIPYEYNNDIAIELTTDSYDDYLALGEHIKIEENSNVEVLIKNKFREAFSKVDKDLSKLKWLYEKAPQFILSELGDEKLLADLEKLVAYDKDSWFKDASTAILKLIRGFKNLKKVYDHFNDNPQKAIALYDILSTESKEQFCVLLNTLCYVYTKTKRRTGARFTIGKDYTLNSNIFITDNQKQILLEQSEIYRRTVEVDQRDSFGGLGGKKLATVGIPIPISQKTNFHPLDIVTMVNQATGDEEIVCALNVKLLSDQAEWEQVVNTVVIVASVIVILVSAGTLLAGATGFVAVVAVTEIVVAAIDIVAILNSTKLKETEEGRWFLKHWNTLSAATGVLSLAPLANGVLKNGPKLLSGIRRLPGTAKTIQLREFINKLITSIQVELYFIYKQGFVYCSIVPFPNVPKIVGKPFAEKMKRVSVLITEPVEAGTPVVRALIYNGEKIAEGVEGELKAELKKIFPHKVTDADAIKYLDDLVDQVKRSKYFTKRRLEMIPPDFHDIRRLSNKDVKVAYRSQEIESFIELELKFNGITRGSKINEAGDVVMTSGPLSGKSLDPMGLPSNERALDAWRRNLDGEFLKFKRSINKHFKKIAEPGEELPALDIVVIDFKNMDKISPDLKKRVLEYIESSTFEYKQYVNDKHLIKLNF